jgi:ribose transport system ATP-binding protein
VLLDLPISQNITLTSLRSISGRFGRIDRKKEEERVKDLVDKLKIKIGRTRDSVSTLSGGNQQKVALAKWLGSNSKVLIFDEPTRGVDVGAKVEIYRIINALAEEGVAIIMVSSEMPEIIGMSDRVLVMRDGRVMGELSKPDINEENMIKLSMGVTR